MKPSFTHLRRRLLTGLPAILFALSLSLEAWARVGGGHTYSGGHSSGGSHGGGSSGSGMSAGEAYFLFDAIARLLGLLVHLTFAMPAIGLPIDAFLFFVVYKILKSWSHPGYDITNEHGFRGENEQILRNGRIAAALARLAQIRVELDPNFSAIALMDFLHALYATAQHTRGTMGKLQAYSGYFSPQAMQALSALNPGGPGQSCEVKSVVVGAATIVDAGPVQKDQPLELTIEFEACYSETIPGGTPQNWYARETWKLSRQPGVVSREPANIRQIACPACGAPANSDAGGKCPSCGNLVKSGDFDWYVDGISCTREQRPPGLVSDSGEEGNSLPTLLDPHFSEAKAAFEAQAPDFKWDEFSKRTAFIFMQLQKAWTERKWEVVRPFESDSVFESHSYWIQEYKRQHLVNVLKDIQLLRMEPVKIQQDKFFSAITLRIHASMIDCTQSEDGKLQSGSPDRPRPFTEYWTFVRGRSAQTPKPGAGPMNCPACGAQLKINMAGTCEYCNAKITSGDFDWVLSSIEQDEAYTG